MMSESLNLNKRKSQQLSNSYNPLMGPTVCSGMIITKIGLINPSNSFSSSYYLNILVSNLSPQKSKSIEFSKNGISTLNENFSLKNGETRISCIKLELLTKKNYLVLKGDIYNENFIYDNSSNSYICYLLNNENKKVAYVNYTIKYSKKSKDNIYEKNIRRVENVYKRVSTVEYNTKRLFLLNMTYLKLIFKDINSIINWQNKWRTLSYLFVFSFIVLFFKIFYVFIFNLYLIYIHLSYKGNIEQFLITKNANNEQFDRVSNSQIFYKIMSIYNKIIEIYEKIMTKLIKGNRIKSHFYLLIAITTIANVIFFNGKLYRLLNFKYIIIIIVWYTVLKRNPCFYSFFHFISDIINERTLFITSNPKFFYYKNNLESIITLIIPFYTLYNLYIDEGVDRPVLLTTEAKKNPNDIKFELYENERWWMLVGWNKNLAFKESQQWCKVEKINEYCDKNMIDLPNKGNVKYQWNGDWKIETYPHCDELGWEYSVNFDKPFGMKTIGKYVRRRKWIRIATEVGKI